MTLDPREFDRALAGPGPVAPPSGLADRITAAAVRDYKVRTFTRRVGWTAAAAVLLVGGWFAIPNAGPRPDGGQPVAAVHDPIRSADSALTSLSRTAADRVTVALPTLTPNSLLPAPVAVPAGPTVSTLPESTRTAFEPVTATAGRAFGRFLNDLGSATGTPRAGM